MPHVQLGVPLSGGPDRDRVETDEVTNSDSGLGTWVQHRDSIRNGYYDESTTHDQDFSIELSRTRPSGRHGWTYPPPLLERTNLNRKLVMDAIRAVCDRSNMNYYAMIEDDLLDFRDPVRSTVHSFIVDVAMYALRIPEERRPISISEILYLGYDFDGAKKIDALRDAQLKVQLNKTIISPDPAMPKRSLMLNFQIGDFYRPNKMVNWKPTSLDWRPVVYRPLQQEEQALSRYRLGVRKWIQKFSRELSFWSEVPFAFCQQHGATVHKEGPWCETKRVSGPVRERGVSRMVDVPRELKEARWACIEDAASVVTLQWIDSNVKSLTAFDPRDASRWKVPTVFSRMKKAMKKIGATAYCRDFKKEGLSKPRNLLVIMCEELHVATGADCFEYGKTFFSSWSFEDEEGRVHTPPRGHGLGMAVGLTTLMQIIIEESLEEEPVMSMYNNDDAFLVFENSARASHYAGRDRRFCDAIGHAFKEKSTFLSSEAAVFCEIYYSKRNPFLQLKNGYEAQEIGLAFKAINAAHARSLCAGYVGRLSKDACDHIAQYWGHILYCGEHRAPRELGGWFSRKIAGVDVSWYNLPGKGLASPENLGALEAYKSVELLPYGKRGRVKKDHPWKGEFGAYGEVIGFNDGIRADAKFRAQAHHAETNTSAWDAYFLSLRKVFGAVRARIQRADARVEYRTVFDGLEAADDRLPPRDHLPRFRGREWFIDSDIESTNPFSSTRSDLMYAELALWPTMTFPAEMNWGDTLHYAYERTGKVDRRQFDMCGFPQDPNMPVETAASRVFALRKTSEANAQEAYNAYVLPHEETPKYWLNPINVQKAYLGMGAPYVELKEPSAKKKELLAKRDSYYGRMLLPKEWMMLSSIKPCDTAVIAAMSRKGIELDKLVQWCRELPGFGLTRTMWLSRPFEDLFIKWYSRRLEKAPRRLELRNTESRAPPGGSLVLRPGWDLELDENHNNSGKVNFRFGGDGIEKEIAPLHWDLQDDFLEDKYQRGVDDAPMDPDALGDDWDM